MNVAAILNNTGNWVVINKCADCKFICRDNYCMKALTRKIADKGTIPEWCPHYNLFAISLFDTYGLGEVKGTNIIIELTMR